MGANAFLVRYAGGWAERIDGASISIYGRLEALLGLGALSSLAEVNRVADGQLADFATPRVQTDITIEPRDTTEIPQVGQDVTVEGDPHRVLAVNVSENDNGDVFYLPVLNENVVLTDQQRIAQAVGKMLRGTMGGQSKVAQPVVPDFIPRGRAPSPGVVYLETFPGVDRDLTDGGTDLDWTWDDVTGGPVPIIIGNKCTSQPSLGGARAEHETRTTDMYVQADISTMADTDAVSLIARWGENLDFATDTAIALFVSRTGSDTYIELSGWGIFGLIDSDTLISTSPNATWRIECEGTTIRGYRDDIEVLTGTSSLSPQPAGTRAGFQMASASVGFLDNFEYGDL